MNGNHRVLDAEAGDSENRGVAAIRMNESFYGDAARSLVMTHPELRVIFGGGDCLRKVQRPASDVWPGKRIESGVADFGESARLWLRA